MKYEPNSDISSKPLVAILNFGLRLFDFIVKRWEISMGTREEKVS